MNLSQGYSRNNLLPKIQTELNNFVFTGRDDTKDIPQNNTDGTFSLLNLMPHQVKMSK